MFVPFLTLEMLEIFLKIIVKLTLSEFSSRDMCLFSYFCINLFFLILIHALILTQEHHFSLLQRETEKLRNDIDKMRIDVR